MSLFISLVWGIVRLLLMAFFTMLFWGFLKQESFGFLPNLSFIGSLYLSVLLSTLGQAFLAWRDDTLLATLSTYRTRMNGKD